MSEKVVKEKPDIETQDDLDLIDQHLGRILSNPDSTDRINELVKRASINNHQQLLSSLSYDPNDFDLQILLRTLVHQLKEQNLDRAVTGVTLENVTSYGINTTAVYGPSFGAFYYWVASLFKKKSKAQSTAQKNPTQKIIRNVNGIVKSGEMLLVLGRPGSGCSTFLKTAAGETDQLVKVEGDVKYDNVPLKTVMKTFRSEIIYNPERKWFG
jgi:ABC-type multidrug transport system fused ATPase/permease subunit